MALNQQARSLIERAAPGREPTAEDRERMRTRISEQLALAAAVAATKAAAAPAVKGGASIAAPAAKASLGIVKLVAMSIVGVGLAGGVVLETMHHDRPARTEPSASPAATAQQAAAAPARGTEPSVSVSADPVAAEAPAHAPAAETSTPSGAVAPAMSSPRAAASNEGAAPLDEEISLLGKAERAISRGESGAAMDLLAEHERRFPNGTLSEERTAARVVALCDLGRAEEARAAADAFLRDHPGSTLADRVRSSCAGRKSAP